MIFFFMLSIILMIEAFYLLMLVVDASIYIHNGHVKFRPLYDSFIHDQIGCGFLVILLLTVRLCCISLAGGTFYAEERLSRLDGIVRETFKQSNALLIAENNKLEANIEALKTLMERSEQ